MATPPNSTPPISPDGHYWWDGQAWQPIQAQAPTAPAPVPAPAPDQPSWLVQPMPTLAAAPPRGAAAPPPAPGPAYYPQQPAAADPWNTPAPPPTRVWIYATGLLMLIVIGIAGYVGYGALKNANNAAAVQTSPSPLISDYERADRFLNVDLGPPLVEVEQATPAVSKNCTSSLPPSCKDALVALDKAMLHVDDAMSNNQRDIPVCIGRPVQQFKDDWTGMEQGVALAVSGYQSNSRTLILQGLQKFAAIAQYLQADVDRINKAEKTCTKTV